MSAATEVEAAEQHFRDVLAALRIPIEQRPAIMAAASTWAKARAHAERDRPATERCSDAAQLG